MSIASARMSASLAHAVHCPLCGTDRNTATINVPGLSIDVVARRAWVAGHEVNLTVREFDLLRYFASRPNAVVTKKELFREIWGFVVMPRSTRTVDSHVSRLRTKLAGVDHSTIEFQNIWGTGWRFASR